MNPKKVTFDKVKSLYPNHTVIGVREAWKEGIGWFSEYNEQPLNDPIKSAEEQILLCDSIGATSVNLILKPHHLYKNDTFSDYKLSELME